MTKWTAVLTAIWLPVLAQAAPRLIFTKSFPGSVPAYVEISVEKDGTAVYKEAPDDNNPISIHLTQADADAMFSLADKLNHFADPLEANVKVAFMGKKTFRYEDPAGTEKPHQAEFNYSADPNAQALLDWFERIAESERDFIELERTVKYDKLGVQDALLRMQATHDQNRLLAPQQFLPLLDRVVRNESYMNIARQRAALFAQEFRAQPQAPAVNTTQK
ncbi:MAG TPA: hypothetical protein VN519_01755 [Bryobacteraceae bacterium]|nr:hypothetical protein [Bryobacteraceae bacterium]